MNEGASWSYNEVLCKLRRQIDIFTFTVIRKNSYGRITGCFYSITPYDRDTHTCIVCNWYKIVC